jgi:uncharacterized protein YkwD
MPLLRECARKRIVSSVAAGIVFCMGAASLIISSVIAICSAAVSSEGMNSRRIIALINAYRSQNGLSTLRENPKLGMSAALKVDDMIRQSYFAHTSPDGRHFSDNVKKARYNYRSVAEVLARGCRDETQVIRLWSKSPSHNDALLNPAFQEINCSSSSCGSYRYVACHLARPRGAPRVFRN